MNKIPISKPIQLFGLCAAVLLCAGIGRSQAPRGKQTRKAIPPAAEKVDSTTEAAPVRLHMRDGVRISVAEAWESEQGFWYKQGGITHLVPRDRVKSIERGSDMKVRSEPQIAKVTE